MAELILRVQPVRKYYGNSFIALNMSNEIGEGCLKRQPFFVYSPIKIKTIFSLIDRKPDNTPFGIFALRNRVRYLRR